MEMRVDEGHIGNFMVLNSRLVKIKETPSKSEEEKNGLIKQIGEKCVPKQFIPVLKREMKEEGSQTEDISKSKRKCPETRAPSEIPVSEPKPSPTLDDIISFISSTSADFTNISKQLTREAANAIGGCTRLILRTIIENAKTNALRENRQRIVPSDVDLAICSAEINSDFTCPLLKPTPATDRMYWGRKMTKPKKTIDANSSEIVSHERFCDSIMIKDHWLVVDGVQPCVPENVIPTEVKQKYQEQQQETQRVFGYGVSGVRKQIPEKRPTTQTVLMEHQVLYAEMTKILTNGSALERQKVLETIETDTGFQFLAGRFVILIAEGVRLHIGTKNIRGLANLLKLAWSLMKNPHIWLEKYLYVLVPSLISCVVSKSMVPIVDPARAGLKTKTSTVNVGTPELTSEDRERIIRDLEFEFKLRESTGKLLAELASIYKDQNLRVRIIQMLRKVLTGNKDPVAIYGVLCTFFAFGSLTINTVVLPRMHDIFCSLQASRNDIPTVKATMTKLRKLLVETEIERMEVIQNKTIELIMKIIFENEIFNERKLADRDAYVALYAEFGALFYDYALNTGMINENTGHLKVNRPSLLLQRKDFRIELEKFRRGRRTVPAHHPHHQQRNLAMMADDDLLDNLLDDSNRPWARAAAQVEETEQNTWNSQDKDTFLRKPKLFLVRKEKDQDGKLVASFIRPLEYGYMPSLPSTRSHRRGSADAAPNETAPRESIIGQSIYASRASDSVVVSKESDEILRRFVARSDEQSGAIIYGRKMLMTPQGRSTIDDEIAQAASQLSSVRLRNSVAANPSAVTVDEMRRGRFLHRADRLDNV
ncbi:hypothetical protein GCK72_015022 [Caenorhabditis remanei]|uniref:TAF6 C-terminal HEAT repeat domain-containing protein n=1 Tax=Caenorhabditis remanei TaxID=31234 RepID=A0A6A5GVZ4_CAERE|nr:hypothetical protein GCK72_015022 [Caenorhabditis remanei]KAF1758563.1 hypothetical protein GCK72_015022 [Caenorhabditis remanei]